MTSAPDGSQSAVDLTGNVWRFWWVVVLLTTLGGAAGYAATEIAPVRYTATVTLVVKLSSDAPDTEALVRTAQALTTSSVVLHDIARSSGTGLTATQVGDRMKVERSTGSAVIDVTVEDTNREQARELANQIVPSLTGRIDQTADVTNVRAVPLSVQTFGGGPQMDRVPRPLVRNAAIGAAAGAGLGFIVANALGAYSDRREERRRRRDARKERKLAATEARRQEKEARRDAKAERRGVKVQRKEAKAERRAQKTAV